jgi:hypothetical protein
VGLPKYIKNNFSKGIVSPAIQAQFDSEKYAQGVKWLKNMIVLPDGGLANRPGTQYIAEQKDVSYAARVIDFVYADDSYVIELGHLYIRFYKNGEQIESGGSPYEIVSTFTYDQLADIDYVQSGSVIYLFHQDHQPQTLTRTTDTSWALADYEYTSGPFMPLNTDATETITPSGVTGNITLTAITAIFSNATGATHSANKTLWQLNEVIPAQHLASTTIASTGTSTSSIKCGGTWRIITHGTWTGTLGIEISSDGGATWRVVRNFSSAGTGSNFDTYGTEDPGYYLVRVTSSDAWTGTAVIDLSSDSFVWSGVVKITQVPAGGGGGDALYNTADATVIDTLASTAATADWAEGSWSEYRGYPSSVSFYQDRLCSAGTVSEPNTVWLSETGYYESYRRHLGLLDSDGISVNLPSRTVNDIRHLIPLGDLLILTNSGEWSLSAENGILTPTTVQTKFHGYAGSSKVSPVVISNRVIYVDDTGVGLRDTGYNFESRGYEGASLTDDAPQLFEGYTIVALAYQRKPFPILWCVRSDGALLSLTYTIKDGARQLGWSYHETPEGYFKSVCVVPGTGGDELWFLINRPGFTYGTNIPYLIEKMNPREASNISYKQVFVDCSTLYSHTFHAYNSAGPITFSGGEIYLNTQIAMSNGDKIKIFGLHDSIDSKPGYSNYYTVFGVTGTKFKIYYADTTDEVPLDEAYASIVTNGNSFDENGIYEVALSVSGLKRFYRYFSQYTSVEISIVDVLLDGLYYSSTDLSTAGLFQIPIGPPYLETSNFVIGLKYDCLVELLPPAINFADGPMIGKIYNIPIAMLRLNDSIGGKVGPDEDNLLSIVDADYEKDFGKYEDDDQTPTVTAPKYYLTSGDSKNNIYGENRSNATIVLKQDEPYPFEVLIASMVIDLGGDL